MVTSADGSVQMDVEVRQGLDRLGRGFGHVHVYGILEY